jgi:hypothetical protein
VEAVAQLLTARAAPDWTADTVAGALARRDSAG